MGNSMFNRFFIIIIALTSALTFSLAGFAGDASVSNAYRSGLSGVQLQGAGLVVNILSDDTKGSRHQRFILKMPVGLTLLIAHNIDLAPRINNISLGDTVEFYGQYEWNDKGGIVHWTHHDPAGRHVGGWLKHNGMVYE